MTSSPNEVAAERFGRVVILALLLIFFCVQGDGFWRGIGARQYPHLLQAGAVLLLAALGVLFSRRACARLGGVFVRSRIDAVRACLLFAAASQIVSGCLFFISAHYYRFLGYRLYPAWTIVTTGIVAAVFVYLAFRRRAPSGGVALAAVLLAITAFLGLSIISFPLTVARSDNMPLIAAADLSALHGHNPYHSYDLVLHKVFLTYLPGTWMAYFPAAVLHLDLRIVTLLCELALAVVVFFSVRRDSRAAAVALMAGFFCNPYVQYHHDIYIAPQWLFVMAALLFAFRGLSVAGAAALGVAIATTQFAWVIFPFYVLFYWQRFGWRDAMKVAAIALAVTLIFIGPFLLIDAHSIFFGVLGQWPNGGVNARPVNFSTLVAQLGGMRALQPVQALVMATVLLVAVLKRGCRTPAGCLRWMATALLLFILFNMLVWGYFFLLVALLLALYVIVANGWLAADL